jgi:hypothetical protein
MTTTDASLNAAEFFHARFGERRTLGRRQAIDYAALGWGLAGRMTRKAIGAAFDAAEAAGELGEPRSVTFRVGYHMAPGCSAGGSSIGTRPVSADMFHRERVDAWARGLVAKL